MPVIVKEIIIHEGKWEISVTESGLSFHQDQKSMHASWEHITNALIDYFQDTKRD